jgi:hypothetical protein
MSHTLTFAEPFTVATHAPLGDTAALSNRMYARARSSPDGMAHWRSDWSALNVNSVLPRICIALIVAAWSRCMSRRVDRRNHAAASSCGTLALEPRCSANMSSLTPAGILDVRCHVSPCTMLT